jgi:hypothetical protein
MLLCAVKLGERRIPGNLSRRTQGADQVQQHRVLCVFFLSHCVNVIVLSLRSGGTPAFTRSKTKQGVFSSIHIARS